MHVQVFTFLFLTDANIVFLTKQTKKTACRQFKHKAELLEANEPFYDFQFYLPQEPTLGRLLEVIVLRGNCIFL